MLIPFIKAMTIKKKKIYIFNLYCHGLISVYILRINNCVGLLMDFFGVTDIFISVSMMHNWLCFYIIN